VLEALLLEQDFSEEALKDEKALKKFQTDLQSYINLVARTKRRFPVR